MPPSNGQKLVQDVEHLASDAVLIHNSFVQIDEELSIIAEETLSFFHPHLFFRQDVLKFQDDLQGYHKQYKDLLWKSRDVAGAASAKLDDFLQTSLPFIRDGNVGIDEKVLLLGSVIKSVPADETAAQHTADAFEELHSGLDRALNVWTQLHEQKIQHLSNKESSLQSKWPPARDVAKPVQLSHVLAALSPDYTAHGINEGIDPSPVELGMSSLVDKIQFIHGIWLQICTELRQIHKRLEIQAEGANISLTLFDIRMTALEPVFRDLVEALRAYESGVTRSQAVLSL
ncbi:hypothetical protein EUX98_g4734 [Antrodiella citrinella]|uniref:Uncharacterized protein n=1 Tax=Antrodiella citrinella TaxID=2447956 RepID=A0A4S4MTF4_9APHY|nr:hypothetical protein EUX98_g4734 [Antrodiella citrinella]